MYFRPPNMFLDTPHRMSCEIVKIQKIIKNRKNHDFGEKSNEN